MRSCARKIPFIALAILGAGCCSTSALALSYSQAVDVSFTFNPTLSISLSSADLVISELVPGSIADSNTIDINVSTNAAFGYTLSANVGNATSYNTRNLIRSDLENSFTSVAIDSSLDNLSSDNTWGFSYKPSSDSASWASYSGLPLYSDTENTKTLVDTNSPLDAQSIRFKIAAKAASTMPAGGYRNVINFIAVAKPEPTPAPIECEENKICYSNNALDNVEGTMGKQSNATSNSTVTLLASNYSRRGFGFAGWNTAPDYSGTNYGPNEDVTMPADMSHGLPLYAIWVKSSGVMQEWNGCIGLNIGDVTALTDARDNDTYAVAKLADGKCWMIENLRLDNTADHNSDGSLSQGYNPSFIGLAGSESANFSNSTTANSLYTTAIGVEGKNTISGDNQGYRFPRYNNNNTSQRAENTTITNVNTYSYGNYYTWHAVIADTTNYTDGDHNTTSICPKGWSIPQGNNASAGFAKLDIDMGGTGASQSTVEASNRWRKYPTNFLYSGVFSSSSAIFRGSYGLYWSSTADDAYYSYYLYLYSSYVYPGTSLNKNYGFTARCVADS
ncbi:InlB B-repeat-containing protein [Candidatus Saccharibacteria bacterium]|nr:InlB B-repeat-containing protein [Candidatus Saccharibacteria bacterium]